MSVKPKDSIEGLALQKPPLPIAALCRQVSRFSNELGEKATSYGTVFNIARSLPADLVTRAHDRAKAYSNKFELVHRREASGSNAIRQADHTPLDTLLLRPDGGVLQNMKAIKRARITLIALILVYALTLNAQSRAAPRTFVRVGRLLDVRGQKVLEKQVLEIENGIIKRISDDSGEVAPHMSVAQIIDLSKYTVLPGLIDCHTHLLQSYDFRNGFDDPNMILTLAQMNTAQRALLGAKNAADVLAAGITTVRDLGNSGTEGDVALRDAILNGWVAGPRMLVSTRAIAPVGGQLERTSRIGASLISAEYAVVTGTDEARRAVRQAFFDGADLIKVIVGYGPRMFTVAELKAIVEEAHSTGFGKKVAAHAIDEISIARAVEAGVDSIEHGYGLRSMKLIQEIAKKRIFFVPTEEAPDDPKMKEIEKRLQAMGERIESAKDSPPKLDTNTIQRLNRVLEAGIPVAFGSDAYYAVKGVSRGQASLMTLRAYRAAGYTSWQIIRAATLTAAELLGIQGEVGSLEIGKAADLIAVDGDVLADIGLVEKVHFVMKGGVVVRSGSR